VYYEPTYLEYQVVIDPNGEVLPGGNVSDPGEGNVTVTRSASAAFIAEFTQPMVGKATVQFDYYDSANDYTIPGRWVTTDLTPTQNIIYQAIMAGTALEADKDTLAEAIFNSPEGVACIPQ